MRKSLLFLIIFLSFVDNGYSQTSYKPLLLNKAGSDALNELLARKYKSLIPPKSDIDLEPLFKSTDVEIKHLVRNGDILFGDTLSNKLNAVAQKLVEVRPSLKGTFRVYVYKTTMPNAFTFPDGSILVTTGLLARLSSESQLAFVIGHELGHLIKKHPEQTLRKAKKIGKEFNLTTITGNSFKILMNYSQENEMEADAIGIELMNSAGFNYNEALTSLRKILLPDSSFKPSRIYIKKLFASPDFNVDSIRKKTNSDEENYVQPQEDDNSLNTHPELTKRLIALKELIAKLQTKSITVKNDSEDYVPIKYIARMENILASFTSGNHDESLYLSIHGLDLYPKNNFLILMISKNLLWLATYKENDNLQKALKENKNIYGGNFGEIEAFISTLSKSDLKTLTYSFIKNNYNSGDEELTFYMAYIAEFYLGSGISRIYYSKYMKEYAAGKYALFVENKLK
ncbi:MAG: M48 family metallopeptidase [Bacteroidetes bacterium]|nr:M48 family metallopeptidase [Bacteroidota bacterium]